MTLLQQSFVHVIPRVGDRRLELKWNEGLIDGEPETTNTSLQATKVRASSQKQQSIKYLIHVLHA